MRKHWKRSLSVEDTIREYYPVPQTTHDPSDDDISVREEAFWILITNGFDSFSACEVWYASYVVLSSFNKQITVQNGQRKDTRNDSMFPEHENRHSQWTVDSENDGGALGQVPAMPRINLPMKYIGWFFTYSCFHAEDKELGPISYFASKFSKHLVCLSFRPSATV